MSRERSQTTPNPIGQPTHRTGKPVVIRPLQSLEGTDQNVPVVAPQGLQGPHRQIEKLEEYVSWLQQQSQKKLAPKLTETKNREISEPSAVNRKVEPSSIARSTNPKELSGSRSFSQPTPPSKPVGIKAAKPIIEFVNKSEPKQFREDQPQTQPQPHFHPAAKIPKDPFQLEADLERILRKLESAESEATAAQAKVLETFGSEPDPFQAPKKTASRKVQPAEFAQPYRGNQPSPVAREANPDEDRLTKSEIIQTISAAIAAVLTEQTEPIIEAKIKERLKDLQLEFVPDSGETYESQIHSTERFDTAQPEISSKKNLSIGGAPKAARSSEIPVNVAAWDVEEFRWPKITDQMINLGGQAIGQLVSTVLETVAGTRRRIAVTAPDRRLGTTSIAISLARWVANEGGRVLLVDADLAHPELSTLVGLGPGISWHNALIANARDAEVGMQHPAEYIIRSQKSPLCVMPLATSSASSQSIGNRYDQLGQLLDPVTFDFDLILLDVGPCSQLIADLSVGQGLVDTALIVHQEKGYKVSQIQNQLRSLDIEQFVFAQNAASQSRSNVA
jgi:Mrp family chromosome partitioning ATPase